MTNTTLTRLHDRAVTDRTELDRLLDDTVLAHVGMVDDTGSPVVIPTGIARDGDHILIHGSTGSGWLRGVAAGRPVCVAVTDLNGIIVARSSFESSFRYRSAVLFGTFTRLAGPDLPPALDVITERFLPGRVAEIRGPRRAELAATMVLAMPIQDWSLKISDGWPADPADDVADSAWAGVVPIRTHCGDPLPAPDLRAGIPVPASVRALTDELSAPERLDGQDITTRRSHDRPRTRHLPVVRHPGRGSRQFLHRDLLWRQARRRPPLHRGRPGSGRLGAAGGVRAQRAEVLRPQRRPAVHVQRGRLDRGPLRGPGRGGLLLGPPGRRRPRDRLRLGQGPVRPVLADRPGRVLRHDPRRGPRPGRPGHEGHADHDQVRPRRPARRLCRPVRPRPFRYKGS